MHRGILRKYVGHSGLDSGTHERYVSGLFPGFMPFKLIIAQLYVDQFIRLFRVPPGKRHGTVKVTDSGFKAGVKDGFVEIGFHRVHYVGDPVFFYHFFDVVLVPCIDFFRGKAAAAAQLRDFFRSCKVIIRNNDLFSPFAFFSGSFDDHGGRCAHAAGSDN
ncbi:hypothetical protein SDC9_178480 [bioreactor metagenome]|uniref:Uncharacterized protein n=1 Tax=bioreactor metagenome TaxID=1076179 RepID=A0A645GZ50_9ZZZZ